MRREVIAYNRIANSKWEHPVFYLYYDENETFLNMEEIISEIKKYRIWHNLHLLTLLN